MKFTEAKIINDNGDWLCLKVDNPKEARQFLDEKSDRPYRAEFKVWREKRTLDANAYFWTLCGKLAEVTSTPRENIYRESIRNIGGNSSTICVQDKAVDRLREGWSRNGLGWVTDTLPSKVEGCTNVILYYGSSTYDRAQMARLIDNIVQDCKAVGVETLPPDKLSLLKEEWL